MVTIEFAYELFFMLLFLGLFLTVSNKFINKSQKGISAFLIMVSGHLHTGEDTIP